MKLAFIRIEPMLGKKRHRAGGAVHSLFSYMNETCTKNENIETKIFDLDSITTANKNVFIAQIASWKPKVIAFSTYCWNIELAKEYVGSLKQLLPDSIIVLGGPEASYNAGGLLEEVNGIDVIIRGEGELTFSELIEAIYFEKSYTDILGLTYREKKNIIENTDRPVCKNINDFPSFYLNGTVDLSLTDGEVAYESVRGCMFSCSYCLHTKGLNGVREYSMERVEEELKYLLTSEHVEIIWFLDPTFNSNEKRAIEILKIIEKYNPQKPVAFEIRADMLTDEIISQFGKVNVTEIGIGIQTSNESSNQIVNRKNNIVQVENNVRKFQKAVKSSCEKFDIDLIYGLPGDTYEDYARSIDYVMYLDGNIYYQPLRIFKGTELYNLVDDYEIVYNDKAPYNTICNKSFTLNDMNKAYATNIGIDFYNSDELYRRIIDRICEFKNMSYSSVFLEIGTFFFDKEYTHLFRIANWAPDDRPKGEVFWDFMDYITNFVEDSTNQPLESEIISLCVRHSRVYGYVDLENRKYSSSYFSFSI